MEVPIWKIEEGPGPLVAAAVHDGHDVRDEIAGSLALTPAERRREEDPYTGAWTDVAPTRIIGLRSRFEVDLNRPREGAVYVRPEDAWGLDVWEEPLSEASIGRSLAGYDAFYEAVRGLFARKVARHGGFVVFDLHSYNHRREGPEAPAADPEANPEVNVGTGSMDRERWAPVVDRFIETLRVQTVGGRPLDVRENVRFQGGHFSTWIHDAFPESGCALAVEFKKVFMDEWTGAQDAAHHAAIRRALQATVPAVLDAFVRVVSTARTT